jgi:hypothetical protein
VGIQPRMLNPDPDSINPDQVSNHSLYEISFFSAYRKLNKVGNGYHARVFYLLFFRNDPKAARSRIDALESPAGPAHLYLQILK